MGSIYYLRRLISRRISFIRHIYERGGLRPIARQTPLELARQGEGGLNCESRKQVAASRPRSCHPSRKATPGWQVGWKIFQRGRATGACSQF